MSFSMFMKYSWVELRGLLNVSGGLTGTFYNCSVAAVVAEGIPIFAGAVIGVNPPTEPEVSL